MGKSIATLGGLLCRFKTLLQQRVGKIEQFADFSSVAFDARQLLSQRQIFGK